MMRKLSTTYSSTPARGCRHWRPPSASVSLVLSLRGGSSHGGGDPKGVDAWCLVVCQYCTDRGGDRRARWRWAAARMGRGWPMSGMSMGEARAGDGAFLFFYSVFAALELCSCEEHYKPRGVRRRAHWVRLRALRCEEGTGVRSLASHVESWPSNLV